MGAKGMIPLFTKKELTQAFSYVIGPERAGNVAAKWFFLFADSVDSAGRFLYDCNYSDSTPPMEVSFQTRSGLEVVNRNWLAELSDEQKENLLLGFSDFLLDLVSLVSSHIAHQVEIIRGPMTPQTWQRLSDLREALRMNDQ